MGYYAAPNVTPANLNTNQTIILAIPTGHDTQNEWTLKFDHNLSATQTSFLPLLTEFAGRRRRQPVRRDSRHATSAW